MKRIVSFLLTGILALSFTSCSNGKATNPKATDTNVISISQLTQREKTLLSLSSDNCFVFDYKVDKSYNWVTVWVEQYDLGKQISKGGVLSTGIVLNKKSMLVATMNHPDKINFNWSLTASSGTAKFTNTYQGDLSVKIAGCNPMKQITITNSDIVLASICYKESGSFSSLSEQFFKNPTENIKEISDCQLAYLLKCRFTKYDPSK